jgi:methionyl aminopeptidase
MRPKTIKEIDAMRQGGKMLAKMLQELSAEAQPGVNGLDLSKSAAAKIKAAGATAVLLGYQGYPDVICITVNNGVVHGIPSKIPFKKGDVLKLDLTIAYQGMVVDAAATMVVGQEPSGDVKRLLEGSQRALEAGIDAIKGAGTRVGDIGSAVQTVLDKYKLGIVRDLVGHGVGYGVHEDPNVPNYGVAGTGASLPAGATIAIEPMATLGDWQVNVMPDGWTIVTADGSLAAHFEHTVLITETGFEILTQA